MTDFLSHDFVRNALLASAGLAPACGIVGYFLTLRNQVFAGDALGHVAFTGAMAGLAFAVSPGLGALLATCAVALLIGVLHRRAQPNDVVTGTVFTWILGLGVFALGWFSTHHSTGNAHAGPSTLFGSILGISHERAIESMLMGFAIIVLMVWSIRPLLFATIDPVVARSRGIQVRALSIGLMLAAGICVAEAVQVIGALLVLALLATPAATAQRLTSNPYKAISISMFLCLVYTWLGVAVSYAVNDLPTGFVITAMALVGFALTYLPRFGQSARVGAPQRLQ